MMRVMFTTGFYFTLAQPSTHKELIRAVAAGVSHAVLADASRPAIVAAPGEGR